MKYGLSQFNFPLFKSQFQYKILMNQYSRRICTIKQLKVKALASWRIASTTVSKSGGGGGGGGGG